MPALLDYHRNVRFQPDASVYPFKIDKLEVRAENFAGGDPISVELWDGSIKMRTFGWRVRATFDWDELKPVDHDLLDTMILDVLANGSTVVDFDPVADPGVKILTMVFEDVNDALSLQYDGGVRSRSASLTLVTNTILASPPVWLTQ